MKTNIQIDPTTPGGKNNQMNTQKNVSSAGTAGRGIARRSFMKRAAALGAVSLLPVKATFAKAGGNQHLGNISESDAAILRFLAAAEILETDLWQQYSDF